MTALPLLLLLAQPPAQGALEQLADAVCAQAQAAGARAPLATSVSAPGHPALKEAFSTLLLARLSAAGLSPRQLASPKDAEAQARALGARALLRLRLTLEGRLAAAGDVVSTWENVFSGRAQAGGRPAAVVFFEVAQDGLVQALARTQDAPALLLDASPLAKWPLRTAALASGDMDGDGRPELAVLTEEAVEVLGRDGRLLARRALEGLPRAEVPSREPFGTLCICEGLLYAYSAGRAQGEVLALAGAALLVRAVLPRPVVACGRPPLEASLLPGRARLAPAGAGWPPLPEGPAAWGLFAQASAQGPVFLLLREDGTALFGTRGASFKPWPGVGAGAALVDTTGDGTLRLAASSARPAPAEDSLRLLSLAGPLPAALEVEGRILQATALALDADGTEALVLGVWRPEGGAELRVVRGAR